MSDKQRRSVDREIRLSEAQMRRPGMNEMPKAEPQSSSDSPASAGLAEEYHYVVTDLKRIAAIAAVMVVVLIALALLLA